MKWLIIITGLFLLFWMKRSNDEKRQSADFSKSSKSEQYIPTNINRHPEEDLSEPWRGRQHLPTDDPNDKPEGERFETWEEAFNRQISDKLEFMIEYADFHGVVTERNIEPISIHLIRESPDLYIKAFCHLRNSERTFLSSRIQSCVNLRTKRSITNLGQYLRSKY